MLAKKVAKSKIKTLTLMVAVPMAKIDKRSLPQQKELKDTERPDFIPILPQPPLTYQPDDRDKH